MTFKNPTWVICFILQLSIHSTTLVYQVQAAKITQSQVVFEFSDVVIPDGDTRALAVAFHAIGFIDSTGESLGEITFGTQETNELQGEGWFSNQNSGKVGPFQWAGGSNKRANMQLTIPIETKGLLLKTHAIEDSIWMKVFIDGDTSAILLVDAYWHDGYVPYKDIIPEPKPITEPEWFADRYFPHFPNTERIYVFRIPLRISSHAHGAVKPDWRIYHSHQIMMNLTLVSMQGIINRSTPRVYIEWYDPLWPGTDPELSWTPHLEKHVEVVRIDLDALSAINFLMRRYKSHFTGAVIYDPDVPETINLATMIAGLEDRIMLAPQQLGLPGTPAFDSITDLQQLVQSQGWDTSEESNYLIYEWVYNNLWPNLEQRIIGIVSPGPPTSRKMGKNSEKYYQLDLTPRDYLIALRLPALWLSPIDEPQASLFSRFLEEAPSPVSITGVFGPYEWETVNMVSRHGGICAGLNWPGGWINTGGMSVLSGVRPEIEKYRFDIDPNRIMATLGNKPVVNLTSSDGDAIYYQMGHGFGPSFGWEYVQNQRFGWTTNPLMAELAPVLWNYYVKNRSEVSFVSGVSGAGYIFPVEMTQSQLDIYLDRTAKYLAETGDIRVITIASGYNMTDDVITQYFDKLEDTQCLGFETFWKFESRNFQFGYINSHIPFAGGIYLLNETNIGEVVDQIMKQQIETVYIDAVDGTNARHQGEVIQDDDADNGEAIRISKDLINNSIHWALESLGENYAPGVYDVDFRLKVAENLDTGRVASLNINTTSPVKVLASMNISPDDFDQANQYRSFSLEFSVDQLTKGVIFRIVYDGGQTDLYIDNIQAARRGELNMPYFTCVGIDNIGGCASNVPALFQEAFENEGGIVLHPDEFFAALNPDYMINFAIPYLGSEDPNLVLARTQLNEGKYFSSLLTLRNALRVYVGIDSKSTQRAEHSILQNHPNPFNTSTTIYFSLTKAEHVKLEVFNIFGQRIFTILDEPKETGKHSIRFDSQNLSSGLYILQLTAGTYQTTKKMIHVK